MAIGRIFMPNRAECGLMLYIGVKRGITIAV